MYRADTVPPAATNGSADDRHLDHQLIVSDTPAVRPLCPEVHYVRTQCSLLSEEQKKLITTTFQRMDAESTKNGVNVFVRLFTEFPDYKELWPQFRAIQDSALVSSDQLRRHAKIYMRGLRLSVEALDDEVKLVAVLRKIADAHARHGVHQFHIHNMLPEVVEVLCQCLHQRSPEVNEAWAIFLRVIGNIIDKLGRERKWSE